MRCAFAPFPPHAGCGSASACRCLALYAMCSMFHMYDLFSRIPDQSRSHHQGSSIICPRLSLTLSRLGNGLGISIPAHSSSHRRPSQLRHATCTPPSDPTLAPSTRRLTVRCVFKGASRVLGIFIPGGASHRRPNQPRHSAHNMQPSFAPGTPRLAVWCDAKARALLDQIASGPLLSE